jgi:hypothetical protein
VDEDGDPIGDGSYNYFGEVEPLTLSFPEDIIQKLGRTCVTNGLVVGTRSKPADAGGSLKTIDYQAENVAMALRATTSARAISETTLAAEALTMAALGVWYDVGTGMLSGISVKDDADAVTYVLGTDYEVQAELGLFLAIDGGAIAAGDIIHISATGAADTSNEYTIGAGSSAVVEMKGTLTDDFSGKKADFHLRQVRIVSDGDYVVISEEGTDQEEISFKLTPMVPPGEFDYGNFGGEALS